MEARVIVDAIFLLRAFFLHWIRQTRRAPDASKILHDPPKTLPDASKTAPRRLRDGSKLSPQTPEDTQTLHKTGLGPFVSF